MTEKVYAVKYNEVDKTINVETLKNNEYIELSKKQRLVWELDSFEQAFNAGLISADDYCIRIIDDDYREFIPYQVVYYTDYNFETEEKGPIIDFDYFDEEPEDAHLETYNMPAMGSKYAEVYYDKYDSGEYDELVYEICLT